MLPLHKIIWHEWREKNQPVRVPEPSEAMEDVEQIRSYVKAYEWGGPTSALQLHHLRELSSLIRPGDTVLDLACGPGPLLLELAPLYPDCKFIGVDLSQPMLAVLREQANARGLRNVEILYEDIRTLPSLRGRQVDLVITTSALHHLPDLDSLRMTFQRIESLLTHDGGFYIFDFGLLRSAHTQKLMVAEVAKLAPPITAKDYEMSLKAAFPLGDVLNLAREQLSRPFRAQRSSFVEFFYFLQTRPRTETPASVANYIASVRTKLSPAMKLEHLMLRTMRRHC
ncbi:MAG: class I SAM-dependent methyltransferase [Rhodocyclaceae bacterium]|nr:class I SAM-dependent methyltransferase [Rhodocyclaceae bacterium]